MVKFAFVACLVETPIDHLQMASVGYMQQYMCFVLWITDVQWKNTKGSLWANKIATKSNRKQ